MVAVVICGDDPIPNKPAPEALWQIASQLDIQTKRIMMVGDTLNDMQFARNAGVGYLIGMESASGASSLISSYADAVVTSLDQIEVC
jgi:phosphoglycolate phosphatase-like HAD superfamily hydrolase